MSFGFSIGDFIALSKLANSTVQNARKAVGAHDALTNEVSNLHLVLRRLEAEASKPDSLLLRAEGNRKRELARLIRDCERVLRILSQILEKYNGLSEEKRRATKLWQKVRFGNGEMQDVGKIRTEISTYMHAISLFLSLLSIGSQGKVERYMDNHGDELRDIKESLHWITATMQASGHEEQSILTSYAEDDRAVWKAFRRELIQEGYSSRTLGKYKRKIKQYVMELGERGVLDDTIEEEEVASSSISHASSSSSTLSAGQPVEDTIEGDAKFGRDISTPSLHGEQLQGDEMSAGEETISFDGSNAQRSSDVTTEKVIDASHIIAATSSSPESRTRSTTPSPSDLAEPVLEEDQVMWEALRKKSYSGQTLEKSKVAIKDYIAVLKEKGVPGDTTEKEGSAQLPYRPQRTSRSPSPGTIQPEEDDAEISEIEDVTDNENKKTIVDDFITEEALSGDTDSGNDRRVGHQSKGKERETGKESSASTTQIYHAYVEEASDDDYSVAPQPRHAAKPDLYAPSIDLEPSKHVIPSARNSDAPIAENSSVKNAESTKPQTPQERDFEIVSSHEESSSPELLQNLHCHHMPEFSQSNHSQPSTVSLPREHVFSAPQHMRASQKKVDNEVRTRISDDVASLYTKASGRLSSQENTDSPPPHRHNTSSYHLDPKWDEQRDFSAQYMQAGRKKGTNTRKEHSPPPSLKLDDFAHIPLHPKWADHKAFSAEYMRASRQKVANSQKDKSSIPSPKPNGSTIIPLDPKWADHKAFSAEYMRASRQKVADTQKDKSPSPPPRPGNSSQPAPKLSKKERSKVVRDPVASWGGLSWGVQKAKLSATKATNAYIDEPSPPCEADNSANNSIHTPTHVTRQDNDNDSGCQDPTLEIPPNIKQSFHSMPAFPSRLERLLLSETSNHSRLDSCSQFMNSPQLPRFLSDGTTVADRSFGCNALLVDEEVYPVEVVARDLFLTSEERLLSHREKEHLLQNEERATDVLIYEAYRGRILDRKGMEPRIMATEEDARAHRIPPGYSLKHWDPSQVPVIFWGSVFDCKSLGKYFYDWTEYNYGKYSPTTDLADELWLLLVRFSDRAQAAEECTARLRLEDQRELVEEFIEAGYRLLHKLKCILKACEAHSVKVCGMKPKDLEDLEKLPSQAIHETVFELFRRDRKLHDTKNLMSSMWLWIHRFDGNCRDVLVDCTLAPVFKDEL